ncbi:MarR family transcriptional regulator [Nocardioides sp. BP30]|uniref:MarR family winged helix-turn-helix transcriptional regulator n=1 Tax=Nocardioides sp. BP30 TaxID=3036374 RepID=UPI002468C6E7|nr:MarR family transcriptional regulator [Nocardioides sp. BP30]WGL52553.1 MarR family transcriptional regulator [Nocardioides sp. BP30]
MSYPQLRLDQQLCFPLYAAGRAVTRVYGLLLAELDLTYPQYLVLLVLWERSEPVAVGDLGQALRLDSGTLSPLLKRLESAGLVLRRRDPEDERRVLVELSAAGRALEERAAGVPLALGPALGMTPAQARELSDRLYGLLDNVEGYLASQP